MHAPLQAL
jgi:hypothetical protein